MLRLGNSVLPFFATSSHQLPLPKRQQRPLSASRRPDAPPFHYPLPAPIFVSKPPPFHYHPSILLYTPTCCIWRRQRRSRDGRAIPHECARRSEGARPRSLDQELGRTCLSLRFAPIRRLRLRPRRTTSTQNHPHFASLHISLASSFLLSCRAMMRLLIY